MTNKQMTAIDTLNSASQIAYEADQQFPNYMEWFSIEAAAGRLQGSRFTLEYKTYEAAKMAAAKRAIAEAFNTGN